MASEEIFTEIEEEITTVSETTAEAMEIVSDDIANVSDDVINVTDEVTAATTEVNAATVNDLITSDETVMESLTKDVSTTTEDLCTKVESETGAVGNEVAQGAGSEMSTGKATQKAGADAVKGGGKKSGFWYRLKQVGGISMKVFGVYVAADFIGKMVVSIVDAIQDSTKNPPWKGSLTKEQKAQLIHLSNASIKLKDIFETWNEGLQVLEEDAHMSYGTMETTVGGRKETVQVIDVCAYLIMDAIQEMEDANAILKKGINEISPSDLTQVTSNVFTTFSNAQALIDLRDNKKNLVKDDMLAHYKFPSSKDDSTVKLTLITEFPTWRDSVKSQGLSIAKLGATYAVGTFVKTQVIFEVHDFLREHIYPEIQQAAKDAGAAAAKSYVQGEKGTIIAKALIPIVGPEKARAYGAEVKEKAIKKAKEAAAAAGKTKAEDLKGTIKEALEPIVQKVKEENKVDMTQIADYAAKKILQAAFPPST